MIDYTPVHTPSPKLNLAPGEFCSAALHLEHNHAYGLAAKVKAAGATIKYVYDPDPAKIAKFLERFPEAKAAESVEVVLDDPEVRLVTAAAVPCDRGPLGVRVMRAGKDYYTDKTPFTTLDQLAEARRAVEETGRKFMVAYSGRLQNEPALFAEQLIKRGAIGKVVALHIFAPHRLKPDHSPPWFFKKAKYGGILTDLGTHQSEMFLHLAGARDAEICSAHVDNVANPQYPELEDYGEVSMISDTGVKGFYRVDWLTPSGLSKGGQDGRTFIIGTEGYIELRKYIDITTGKWDRLYIVNGDGEQVFDCTGFTGSAFYPALLQDCLERTETAMTQAHAFKAAELCLLAQEFADQRRRERNPSGCAGSRNVGGDAT